MALTAVIQEAYIQGISTRSVDDLVKAMKAFLNRTIEGDWPCMWIDATYKKVRRAGRIVSVAFIVAAAP